MDAIQLRQQVLRFTLLFWFLGNLSHGHRRNKGVQKSFLFFAISAIRPYHLAIIAAGPGKTGFRHCGGIGVSADVTVSANRSKWCPGGFCKDVLEFHGVTFSRDCPEGDACLG